MNQQKFNFRLIADRLGNREDSEHEQVLVKCLLGIIWLAYISWVNKYQVISPDVIIASIYFIIISLMILVWIIINPDIHP